MKVPGKSSRPAKPEYGHISRWLDEIFAIYPTGKAQKVPIHSKHDPIPHLSAWHLQRWVLLHAFIPLVFHQALTASTGLKMGSITASIFYSIELTLISMRQIHLLIRLGRRYGFFDGEQHLRDSVARIGGVEAVLALIKTSTLRPILMVFLRYNRDATPFSLSWGWLPLEIGLYGLVVDFWFYCYHRVMHETNLWAYHRKHHLVKHPSPLHTLYADVVQQVLDIAVIPILTLVTLQKVGLPMGFYEWWICQIYIVFGELAGHCGVRVHAIAPSPFSGLLSVFDVEASFEDHDLHHRYGWRKSRNYGKQSRLWDRIFGTCGDRVESPKNNIDYSNPATFPVF